MVTLGVAAVVVRRPQLRTTVARRLTLPTSLHCLVQLRWLREFLISSRRTSPTWQCKPTWFDAVVGTSPCPCFADVAAQTLDLMDLHAFLASVGLRLGLRGMLLQRSLPPARQLPTPKPRGAAKRITSPRSTRRPPSPSRSWASRRSRTIPLGRSPPFPRRRVVATIK